MSEHVHFFSLGKHSFTTYFLTMKEVKPTRVYLVCDQDIYDKGNKAYETLSTAKKEKKITKLPTLWDMHNLLGNPLEATDSAEIIIQNRLSALENLVPHGLKSDKEFVSDWEKILFLEKKTGIADLKVIDKEAYAVREARVFIYESQKFINDCHKYYSEIKQKYPSDRELMKALAGREIPEDVNNIVSLILKNIDIVTRFFPEFNTDAFTSTDNESDNHDKKMDFYYIAEDLVTTYPYVTIVNGKIESNRSRSDIYLKNPLVIEKRDYNTVCRTIIQTLFNDGYNWKDIKCSMNISAGVNQFCMSLFTVGCWLKAEMYLTPTSGDIILIPLPWSNNTKSDSDSAQKYQREVLLRLYHHYTENIERDSTKKGKYYEISKPHDGEIYVDSKDEFLLLEGQKDIIDVLDFPEITDSSKRTTIYGALGRLQNKKYVVSRNISYNTDKGRKKSKTGYLLTEAGIDKCRMLEFGIESYDPLE